MPKTLIIALKINCLDEGFQDYLKLSGIEKLNLIERRLKDVCEQLNISNPNDKWILAWREHGLSTICTPELKKEFKNRMLKLTKSYPHLTIIGGTMLSVKKSPSCQSKRNFKILRPFFMA